MRSSDAVKGTESMSRGERAYRVQSQIRNLAPGQTIQGAVVSRNGSSVQIALRQDMMINARIDQNINLALGQNMSFEVKANNGSVLSLTPLYANMANEPTILRALGEAGLPETANNIEMVAVMMEEGMPIDKESLANVSRLLMEFPTQDPAALIQMTRLGLPISEAGIEQFEQYVNVNHQLVGSAETIMDQLPEVFHELMDGGHADQAVLFYQKILDIFTGPEPAADGMVMQKETAQPVIIDGSVIMEGAEENGQDPQTAHTLPEGQDARINAAGPQEQTAAAAADPAQTLLETVRPEKSPDPGSPAGQAGQTSAAQNPDGTQQTALTDKQWGALSDMLKELGAAEDTAAQIRKGDLPPKEVLTFIRDNVLKAGADSPHMRLMERLLGSREFEGLLKAEIGKQWLIEPQDVADPRKVEQLYERIREQSARLHEALQTMDKADAPAARSVQNLQNNVDFMNQLNHVFTYIQLPLKLAGNSAHGDLYVYTNKKNLAARDGNVSALLHLDMEHLGALDVYVAMQQNKVSTNFTFQDESSLDLVEQHISLLNERLLKRGYDLKTQFSVKEDKQENEIVQAMLSAGKNISVLSRTSFDMRA